MQFAILAIIILVAIPTGLGIGSAAVSILESLSRASERNARNKRHATTLAATRARYARNLY